MGNQNSKTTKSSNIKSSTVKSCNVKSSNVKSSNVKSYLDVFETNPSGNCGNEGNIQCHAVKRIGVGLKYYQKLFTNNSAVTMTEQETKNIFMHFNDVVYNKNNQKQLVNDWIHLVKKHNDSKHIIEIQNELKTNYNIEPCNISHCKILTRHYRARGVDIVGNNNNILKQQEEEQDAKYEFYCDFYHKFHHQIFHLFQMGLRAIPDDDTQEIKANDDVEDDSGSLFVDKQFKKTRDMLQKQKKESNIDGIERYNDENNKFTMHIADNNNTQNGMCCARINQSF